MKHMCIKFITAILLLFLHVDQSFAEGFVAGTLVKIPDGYTKIENVRVGDCVICDDGANNLVESSVTYIAKRSVDRYICIRIGDENIGVACDQQLYDLINDSWISVSSLKNNDVLAEHKINVAFIDETIDVYLIGVADYHNFFVTSADICAHNFVPLVLAISVAFGSGTLEIASISAGIAGLGTYFGYKWHKKNKQQHTIVVTPEFYGSGMMPEDPEDEKKKKRDQARVDYKSLTSKEAGRIAKEFGHRKVKSHPCGDTRNQPVFFNGKNYISPDVDGHNGGVWKVFDRRGNILHTTTTRFEKIVKVYKK
jgi:hypothetical protein